MMNSRKFLTTSALVSILLFCQSTKAQESYILGLPFGQKLDRQILPCKGLSISARIDSIDFCTSSTTLDHTSASKNEDLYRPFGKAPFTIPEWVARERTISVSLDEKSTIVGITAITLGPRSQERIMLALTEKFGKPSTSESRQVKNGFGVTFSIPNAQWIQSTKVVDFSCTGIDACMLRINTPEYDAQVKAEFIERRKKSDKL